MDPISFIGQVSPIPGDTSAPLTLGVLGLIGAAIAATYQRFLGANIKAEAERVANAVRDCEARCKLQGDQIWLLQQQLRESEGKAATWQARSESLGWGDAGSKPSPPRIDPG